MTITIVSQNEHRVAILSCPATSEVLKAMTEFDKKIFDIIQSERDSLNNAISKKQNAQETRKHPPKLQVPSSAQTVKRAKSDDKKPRISGKSDGEIRNEICKALGNGSKTATAIVLETGNIHSRVLKIIKKMEEKGKVAKHEAVNPSDETVWYLTK